MNFRWGGLGRRAKPSPPEMQVGGGSGGRQGAALPPPRIQGGCGGGEAPPTNADSEGRRSEGPDSADCKWPKQKACDNGTKTAPTLFPLSEQMGHGQVL